MTKKRLLKKVICSVLALSLGLSTVPSIETYASTSSTGAKVGDTIVIDTRGGQWLNWGENNGKVYNSKVDFGTFNDVNGGTYENASYCIEPTKPGVSTEGAYSVTLQDFDDDRLRAIFLSGYPNKKPTQLGFASDSDTEQAFYATKMAIDTYITGLDINDWVANPSATNPEYSALVVNAIKKIYNDGMAYDTSQLVDYAYVVEQTDYQRSGDNETYTYKVSTNVPTENGLAGATDLKVSLSGDIPSGTEITDMSGNVIDQVTLEEEFKVAYTLPDGNYTNRTFNINVVGSLFNRTKVYKGVPNDSTVQAYVVYPQWHEYAVAQPIKYSNTPKARGDGSLVIYKYENGTKIPLEGAKFELRSLNGEISNIYTTDSNGEIVIDTLPDGDYILKEIQAPKDYVIDYDFPLNFTMDSTTYPEGQEITIHNKKIPEMEILKVDGETGMALAGATFEIAYNGGAEKTTVTTDSTGKASFQPPYIGMYVVTEIVAPSGYILNQEPQNVYIDGVQDIVVTFKNFEKTTLRITKHDLADGELLPNAEFSIVNKDTGEVVFEGLTDNNGEIIITDLDPGNYIITEMAPPKDYIKVTDSREIKIVEGQDVTVKFDNKLKPSLEITKIDGESKEPLPNTTFRVEKEDGSFSSEFTTDSNGKILLEHIDEGVYTVTEIVSPSGYVIDSTPKTIDVKWQSDNTFIYSLIFDNYTKPSLIVEKYDEATNELLPNAQFRIEGLDNNFLWEGVLSEGDITDGATQMVSGSLEDGRIVLNGLDEGTYKITEINPPNGYTYSDTTENPRTVVIEKNKTTTVKIDNRPLPDLEITKVDSVTNAPVENVTFEIRKTDGEFVAERQTDINGKINLTDIAEGTYTITEKSAPSNYILDEDNIKSIQIKWNGGDDQDGKYELIFENTLKPTLVINKLSATGGFGLKGAKFTIEYRQADGGLKSLGTFTTDDNGQVVVPFVDTGWYVITEIKAPMGYSLPSNPIKSVYLNAGENSYTAIDIPDQATEGDITVGNGSGTTNIPSSSEVKVTYGSEIPEIASLFATTSSVVYASSIDFENYPLNSIVIKKTDALTGQLLAGATFELIKVAEGVSGSGGTTIGTFTTDYTGVIVITGLESGYYIIRETKAPTNYDLNVTNDQQVYLAEDGTSIQEVMFNNYPYGRIVINKMDADTKEPLAGATFEITNSKGEYIGTSGNGHYTTDVKGSITLDNLPPDSYVVTEIKAPTNYAIDQENNVKVVDIGYGETKEVDFYNKAYAGLVIRKLDTDTKVPLAGAEFKITDSDGSVVGNSNGIFVTDNNGLINIPNLEAGSYIVTETKAPMGYVLSNASQTVKIDGNRTYTLDFYNSKMTSLIIKKVKDTDGSPLAGAEFKVTKQNGTLVGTYTTDNTGTITIPTLAPDWYIVSETKAPNGYILDETPKTVEVKTNAPTEVTFTNKLKSGFQIIKIDSITGEPLSGATFTVYKKTGDVVGTYTTDENGVIIVDGLDNGWYKIAETKAPNGYQIDETPKDVELTGDQFLKITFANTPMGGLKIIKTNSKTGEPIAGVEFEINKVNGEKVLNESNGTKFVTDSTGQIYLPYLAEGTYTVTETKEADGYFIDPSPKNVIVTAGKPTILEVPNTPASGLVIIKTDAKTGKPLEGVEFDVLRADGSRVTSNILDNNQANTENNSPNKTLNGSYTTDANGRIYLNHLAVGEYHIVETKALDGYELDQTIHTVTVREGVQETLKVTNNQKAGLRIKKIDSVTKQPIYGVEFRIYDFETKKEVGGPYYTDNNGVIDFAGIIDAGRYTIKETEPAPNYIRDDVPKTVEFKEGIYTEIVWENTPLMGQIQITKKSATDNYTNGLPAGTPLGDAVFEVYDYKTGNVVDQFVTRADGVGVSRPLPLGRYIVKEIKAPMYYSRSDKELDVTIEFSSQILKYEFTNEPANTGVTIKKVGPYEAVNGQEIKYDIKTVKNDSSVPLTDFYFRDVVPREIILTKIVTGTYNQAGNYKIMFKTNKNDYRVAYDNLKTTTNNVVDMSRAALGLYSDERITEVMFVFGNVNAGFMQVETPAIYGKVTGNLPNGHQFANKADIGGKYQGEWVIGNSTWVTTIYNPSSPVMPRTGY